MKKNFHFKWKKSPDSVDFLSANVWRVCYKIWLIQEEDANRRWRNTLIFVSWVIFSIPHTQLPYKPNPGVSTGKCAAGGSGRQRQAEPGSIGCLHLQSGGFPDHLEKRLQCQWPQGLCAVRHWKQTVPNHKHLLTFSCFSDHLWVLHISK